jgi:hypothetical protein
MPDSEKPNEGELILYQTQEGTVRIEVLYESETFWLNQKKIAELFGVDVRTISEHLRNIFVSGELEEQAVLRKIRTTAADGKKYLVNFYNLDAVISVGYRVNSTQATRFRIWATQTLREFVIKGFVLDDERLKLNKPRNWNGSSPCIWTTPKIRRRVKSRCGWSTGWRNWMRSLRSTSMKS